MVPGEITLTVIRIKFSLPSISFLGFEGPSPTKKSTTLLGPCNRTNKKKVSCIAVAEKYNVSM
jgi:hypothetical protein